MITLNNLLSKPSSLHETKSPDWKPTLNRGQMKSKPASSDSVKRYNHVQSRLKGKRECTTEEAVTKAGMPTKTRQLNTTLEELSGHSQVQVDNGMSNHKDCQTEVTGGDIDILQDDCQSMQQEIHELRSKNDVAAFGTEAFLDCDKKVSFYTGLPNQKLLKIFFTFCMSVITVSANSALTSFQEMTLILCRLMLNLSSQDLAYRLYISPGTVSKIFQKWLDILFYRLSKMIKWPEREQLIETTPLSFRRLLRPKLLLL